MNTPVMLSEVLESGKRAVHIEGRHFLDGPQAVRRYVTVKVEGSFGGDPDVRDFLVNLQRRAEPGALFPRDGWILLED
jgi:hypothetical protein